MILPIEIAAGDFFRDLVATGRVRAISVLTAGEKHRRVPFITSDPIDLGRAKYAQPFVDPPSFDYQSPPVNLYQMRDVMLLGNDGVLLRDGAPVRDTVRHISCWLADFVVAEYTHQSSLRLKRSLTVKSRVHEPVFVGFNAAWRNYAHWMQECVPKVIAWIRRRGELGNPKLVMPAVAADSYQAATLRMLTVRSGDVITVGAGEVLAFDDIFAADETELFRASSRVVEVGQMLTGAGVDGLANHLHPS